jgi:ribosomal protein L34
MFYGLGGVYIMKRTFQPNNRNMKKKHGFFSRIKGNVLNSRIKKGRKTLSK